MQFYSQEKNRGIPQTLSATLSDMNFNSNSVEINRSISHDSSSYHFSVWTTLFNLLISLISSDSFLLNIPSIK